MGLDGSTTTGDEFPSYVRFLSDLGASDGRQFVAFQGASEDLAIISSINVKTASIQRHAQLQSNSGPYFEGRVIDGTLYALLDSDGRTRVIACDLASGQDHDLFSIECDSSSSCLHGLAIDSEAQSLVTRERSTGRLFRVRFSGGAEPVDISFGEGTPESLCFSAEVHCWLSQISAGHFRLSTQLYFQRFLALEIDVRRDQITRTLVSQDSEYWDSSPSIHPLGRDDELVRTSDPESGFSQLFVGRTGAPLADLERKTYLSLAHGRPLSSPDEQYAYYIIEDPVYSDPAVTTQCARRALRTTSRR